MKTLIVLEPKKEYRAVLCTAKVVQDGEDVELRTVDDELIATGKTVNVRVNPAWPTTWLYDVTL